MFEIHETKGVIFGLNVHYILLIAIIKNCPIRLLERYSGQ
jgi:hypothetical protein